MLMNMSASLLSTLIERSHSFVFTIRNNVDSSIIVSRVARVSMVREKLSTVIDSREANEERILEFISSLIDFNTRLRGRRGDKLLEK